MSETKHTPDVSHVVGGEHVLRETLLRISALHGYTGEDMGRVAGYRVAAEMAEEGLSRAAAASASSPVLDQLARGELLDKLGELYLKLLKAPRVTTGEGVCVEVAVDLSQMTAVFASITEIERLQDHAHWLLRSMARQLEACDAYRERAEKAEAISLETNNWQVNSQRLLDLIDNYDIRHDAADEDIDMIEEIRALTTTPRTAQEGRR